MQFIQTRSMLPVVFSVLALFFVRAASGKPRSSSAPMTTIGRERTSGKDVYSRQDPRIRTEKAIQAPTGAGRRSFTLLEALSINFAIVV